MQAQDIIEHLGLTDEAIRFRACELERLLTPRTLSGILAQTRGAVCVLLACREHDQKIEARQVALTSCVTVDQLLSSLATCQRMLNIQFVSCQDPFHSSFHYSLDVCVLPEPLLV